MSLDRDMSSKEATALALWVEWFRPREEGTGRDKHTVVNSPFVSGWDDVPYCYFCGMDQHGKEEHEPDCIYVRAKALVESAT